VLPLPGNLRGDSDDRVVCSYAHMAVVVAKELGPTPTIPASVLGNAQAVRFNARERATASVLLSDYVPPMVVGLADRTKARLRPLVRYRRGLVC
jgi:hypothetical protein